MRRLLLLGCFLLLNNWAWALKPSRDWVATPDSLGLRYQTTFLATPDHAQLAGWIVEPAANVPDRHTTMVMAYGDMNNMSYFLHQARALSQGGYRVYMFDYRGFGHSSDFAIDRQQLYYPEFSTDLRTVLADARQRYPRSHTGIIGFSMGTIMGSEVAATSKCDFLIAEGYVASPQRLAAAALQRSQKVVSLPAEAADYALVARRVHCPWLLVGGTADVNTPLADSVAVARQPRRWRQRRQVLCFEGGHQEGFYRLSEAAYGDKYVREVTRFLAAKRS
ncbi:alpha/beta hydrolase family protein [Hymenobacter monticola]|uniref:Alpha/beta fold hydrolase n=1 Tax=Hymenobacter monticola TaxID=1705399 RepID=A0ABY4B1W8_9BACT|nr:alpha/beta fold hydrolase [Hymenobacter monticola]UOE33158.1 alpha/beta fold hydrolase [Hymenobacter monticola]